METNSPYQNRGGRRHKLRGFIIAETIAIVVLLAAGTLVLSTRPVDSMVVSTLNVVMFIAAASVAAIPILVFAFAPILPRSNR